MNSFFVYYQKEGDKFVKLCIYRLLLKGFENKF